MPELLLEPAPSPYTAAHYTGLVHDSDDYWVKYINERNSHHFEAETPIARQIMRELEWKLEPIPQNRFETKQSRDIQVRGREESDDQKTGLAHGIVASERAKQGGKAITNLTQAFRHKRHRGEDRIEHILNAGKSHRAGKREDIFSFRDMVRNEKKSTIGSAKWN